MKKNLGPQPNQHSAIRDSQSGSDPQPAMPAQSAIGTSFREANLNSGETNEKRAWEANRQSNKIKLPSEFDGLSPEVMDYINDYLRENTYADTQRMLFTEYGIKISSNKLFRYREKLDLALHLEISQDTTDAVEQLLNLYNGQPADIDQAGMETLKRRALQLAVSPKTKPSMLLNLMRIFTYEHRQSMDEHRKKMDEEKSAHRARMAAVTERRAKCEEDRVKLLERRQQQAENPKQTKVEFPQELMTRFINEELGRSPVPSCDPIQSQNEGLYEIPTP